MEELPEKIEEVVRADMGREQRGLYLSQVAELKNVVETRFDRSIEVLAGLTRLRQICCDPRLVFEDFEGDSAKVDTIMTLVGRVVDAGEKVLVFSQFVRHLDIVRPILDELGVSYQYLDGSTQQKDRADAVEAFQKGDSNLFLISLKAGGLGLNLTRADFVILLDPWWNPAVEDQASDRAHRIGQTKPVTIYRLIAKQTIEEKIIALHNEKRDLAEKILSGTDTPGSITAEELLKLITES
jgi:SNF2 family DNA or RNA helicase